ncbi:MAG TPA: Gfo/Idh/MocA family oxidoreductase [Methylomirabilota bacterium]|jgi:predicted dehydrogenase|nr:Gfo/Idh/MocA family oxidoreductase [Methylomirabilota bacterium]
MTALGLCIVGCGRFATFHARAARRLRVGPLSFASRDPALAEVYRRRFGGVAAFGSYEAAAADPRVGALVFCTPHSLHLDNVRLAAKHRKAVLLEKPIARTLDEADEMLAEAAAAGIPFMVAENFHFMPAFVAARRLLAAGAIGEVRQLLVSARGFRRPAGWRRRRQDVGGGILIDGGIHYIHLLQDWAGPVVQVHAVAPPNLFAEVEGEDTAFLLLRFRRGAVGSLANSLASPGLPRRQATWVSGTEGSLAVDNRGRYLWLRSRTRRGLRVFFRDLRGIRAQLADFVGAARENRPPALPAAATRRDLAVVLAAYRSIETGQPVGLPHAD